MRKSSNRIVGAERRARLHAQRTALLRQFGEFMKDDGTVVTAAEYRQSILSNLEHRLAPDETGRKVNAERAMDIVRNGSQSRWWFARHSRSHAGSDNRGIGVWIQKWARMGVPGAVAALCAL